MIKYYEGTVFNTGAKAIVNTVNCEGAMGAGLALEFMLRYPEMFEDYKEKCKQKLFKPGTVDYYKENDSITIINFPTKWLFKFPSRIEWIEDGLKNFAATYKSKGIDSVAFPKLGANNGGLNWLEVKPIMEKYLGDIEAEVYICTDEMKQADGVEKEMLDRFNSTMIQSLSEIVRLTQKQKDSIEAKKPYKRFWHISKTPGIGSKTYANIFRYYYNSREHNEKTTEQLSFI